MRRPVVALPFLHSGLCYKTKILMYIFLLKLQKNYSAIRETGDSARVARTQSKMDCKKAEKRSGWFWWWWQS